MPIGTRLGLLELAGAAVFVGFLLAAANIAPGPMQILLRAAAAPVSFTLSMGLAAVLRRFIVPVRGAVGRAH